MKIRLYCLIVIILSANPALKAQVSADSSLSGKIVSAINIYGNDKTKPYVILREMKQKTDAALDLNLLIEDQQRIFSLMLFNRVIIMADPGVEGVVLNIIVTERWYIFPMPILFINDRDWKKLSYGAGVTHMNFRGRGEIAAFSFWLGYNPSVRLEYSNPRLGSSRNLFTKVQFYLNNRESKHFGDQVKEKHNGFQWTLGKRFGYHTRFSFRVGYKEVKFSPAVSGQTLSTDGLDRLPYLGFNYSWDSRDLIEYPHTGWYIKFGAVKTGLSSMSADYLRYYYDIRKYFPLFRHSTLAVRWLVNMSAGTIPIYNRTYLGYGERIRGHFFDIFEGENRTLAGIGYRFPILKKRYFSLADNPQLSNLQFGISFGLFAETGTVWFQREDIRKKRFLSGFGGGFHFHLPYISLLRLEIAFNELGKHQFLADIFVDI